MTAFFLSLIAFLAILAHSNAAYCVCKDGVSDAQLQKNIDYACANGADCTSITQSGPCYNPNTVKDHCTYAVNSYYQKKGQTALSCDFAGTATTSQTSPSQSSSCVYPTGPGNGGSVGTPPTTGTPPSTGTPTTNTPPTTGTPTTNTPPTTGTPGTPSSSTFTPPGTFTPPTPITTVPGTTPGSYGLPPSGIGSYPDSSGTATLDHPTNFRILISLFILSLFLVLTSA